MHFHLDGYQGIGQVSECSALQAADVYAFGVLMFEMYARRPVWEGLRHPQIIHAIAVQKKHPELPDSAPQNYRVRTLTYSHLPCIEVPSITVKLLPPVYLRNCGCQALHHGALFFVLRGIIASAPHVW